MLWHGGRAHYCLINGPYNACFGPFCGADGLQAEAFRTPGRPYDRFCEQNLPSRLFDQTTTKGSKSRCISNRVPNTYIWLKCFPCLRLRCTKGHLSLSSPNQQHLSSRTATPQSTRGTVTRGSSLRDAVPLRSLSAGNERNSKCPDADEQTHMCDGQKAPHALQRTHIHHPDESSLRKQQLILHENTVATSGRHDGTNSCTRAEYRHVCRPANVYTRSQTRPTT